MNYLARLKNRNAPVSVPTKLTKPESSNTFVGFVSSPSGAFQKNWTKDGPEGEGIPQEFPPDNFEESPHTLPPKLTKQELKDTSVGFVSTLSGAFQKNRPLDGKAEPSPNQGLDPDNFVNGPYTLLTKLTKHESGSISVGFVSTHPGPFEKIQAPEPGPAYRRWQVTDPGGKCWSVTQTPPATAGEMARSWPAGSVLEPMPDAPMPTDSPPLPAAVEAKIQAWLGHIGEQDERVIAEVLSRCQHEPDALAGYLALAAEAPEPGPGGFSSGDANCCGTCLNFQRGAHPHLGTCRVGEPPPTCGQFWDTDQRGCPNWEPKP